MVLVWFALIDRTRAPYRTASVTSAEIVSGKENVGWLKTVAKRKFGNLLATVPIEDLYFFRDLDNAEDDDPSLRESLPIGTMGSNPHKPLVVLVPHSEPKPTAKEWVKTNRTFVLPRTESGQPYIEIPRDQFSPMAVSAFQSIAAKTKIVKKPTDLLVRPMRH